MLLTVPFQGTCSEPCKRTANTPITTISLNGPASKKFDFVWTRLDALSLHARIQSMFVTATHGVCYTTTDLWSVRHTTGQQERFLAIATADQRIFCSVEDCQTTTRSHQFFAFRETFWTIRHHAAIIPMNFHFRHGKFRHIFASRENELHVLCVRRAIAEQQGGGGFNACRIA